MKEISLRIGKELRQPASASGLPKVGMQGIEQGLFVIPQPTEHVGQQRPTLMQRRRRLHPVRVLQGFKALFNSATLNP